MESEMKRDDKVNIAPLPPNSRPQQKQEMCEWIFLGGV